MSRRGGAPWRVMSATATTVHGVVAAAPTLTAESR